MDIETSDVIFLKEFDSFITNLANPKFRRLFELYLKTLYDPQERKVFASSPF
jgi:hypothetical protein